MQDKKRINTPELLDGVFLITKQIKKDNFKPDIIVGISRGGLFLAQFLGYSLDVRDVRTISIQLRDNPNDTKYWVEKKLYEYLDNIYEENMNTDYNNWNILFTDDLIDSGETIDIIKKAVSDYNNSHDSAFNVKFAVSYIEKDYKLDGEFKIYSFANKPSGWLIFPWDNY